MNGAAAPRRSPVAFLLLVLVFTAPFTALDAVAEGRLVPGVPLSGLAFLCPAIAAVALTAREGGGAAVRALLRRSFDGGRAPAKAWFVPAVLLYPAVVTASYLLLRLTGTALPDARISLAPTLLLAAGFFVAALCEELGWSGYATPPLRDRWGGLGAGLLLGGFWAVWHWPALLQVGRPVAWIAWWSLHTVALRVIMVWLFGRMGGSVLAMTLFHASVNLAWQLFPVQGSHFDMPLVASLIAGVALAITLAEALAARRRRPARTGRVTHPTDRRKRLA
jgi:Predicted protease of the Abi (CAAX) family